MTFRIDSRELARTGRTVLGYWTQEPLEELSEAVSVLSERAGCRPVQRGRVIALRHTDTDGLFSAFKASLYHARYSDAANTDRFCQRIAAAHQSYEAIRGESVMFLFVGVGKTVYDALAMFGQGRLARISGGFHHSLPWGVEVPVQAEDRGSFVRRAMPAVERVVELAEKSQSHPEVGRALAEARYELPLCYLVPPFVMEFSEEALMTKVFPQRLWEKGVAQRDSGSVVGEMWECCCALDDKFQRLYDLNGPHVHQWADSMRAVRDSGLTASELVSLLNGSVGEGRDCSAYEALMDAFAAMRQKRPF